MGRYVDWGEASMYSVSPQETELGNSQCQFRTDGMMMMMLDWLFCMYVAPCLDKLLVLSLACRNDAAAAPFVR